MRPWVEAPTHFKKKLDLKHHNGGNLPGVHVLALLEPPYMAHDSRRCCHYSIIPQLLLKTIARHSIDQVCLSQYIIITHEVLEAVVIAPIKNGLAAVVEAVLSDVFAVLVVSLWSPACE